MRYFRIMQLGIKTFAPTDAIVDRGTAPFSAFAVIRASKFGRRLNAAFRPFAR
jgi:hypothetical protein